MKVFTNVLQVISKFVSANLENISAAGYHYVANKVYICTI